MPEYLSPGVYVEEIDTGPVPIEGVSTSTAGFVGMTAQGPTDGLPVLVTSFSEYTRNFGGYLPASLDSMRFLPYAVQGFFENGGQRVYIKRVTAAAPNDPKPSTSTGLQGGLVTRLSKDVNAAATQAQLSTMRGIQNGTKLVLTQVKNGLTTTQTVTVTSYNDKAKTVFWADADKILPNTNYEARYTSVMATDRASTTPAVISAIYGGAWGNSISVQVSYTSLAKAQVSGLTESKAGSGFDTVLLNTGANFYPGAIVEFNKGKTKAYGKVVSISGTGIVLKSPSPFKAATDLNSDSDDKTFITTASTCEFRLTASNAGIVEDYPTLTLDKTTSYYFGTQINGNSALIAVSGDDAADNPFTMPAATDGINITLTGGSDGGQPDSNDYIGVDPGPGQRTGIQALADIDEISIIAAPGITDQPVVNALIGQCELLKYRFAILDPDYKKQSAIDDIVTQRQLYDTHYAALYFPNVVNVDPNPASPPGSTIVLPPGGHIAGIYAQIDDSRGVYKAPANVVIQGITDLDLTINKGEQDVLNPSPNNINVLRNFRTQGRGLRVWGARCITSDTEWKYINVRRLFIFIEHSLDQGTQWVVFEPNNFPLWAQVKQSISNFLTTIWREGGLQGQKVEEAFFVRCDQTTMTQDDIDNGRLIILVGIAPVKPAEFVIIRISQFTAAANAGS
jgi:uncharacterized protein